MESVIKILEERISTSMAAVTGQDGCAAIVCPATEAKFGDYQANGIMPLAKKIKTNATLRSTLRSTSPRELAEQVVAKLDLSDICQPPEIAGPGFINLRLKPEFISDNLLQIKDDNNLGAGKTAEPKTIVVDFSGPNIAKEMHVGHLRSTIIGDCICRMLRFLGHDVKPQNHIGDWGTHFGMLINHLIHGYIAATMEGALGKKINGAPLSVSDMEDFYRQAKQTYDSDRNFQKDSRYWVVQLQKGDQLARSYWNKIVKMSLFECNEIYKKLNVQLNDTNAKGESAYNEDLPKIVEDLQRAGLAQESEGAVCVFPLGFKNKEGKPLPFMIQKSDGAYLYATTDLAAIRYRVNELKADKIIYVTDARQKLHFEMLFAVARMAEWALENVELVHVMFGSVLGENGQPLKTRSGENVKLKDLLDEAIERARKIVEEKNPELLSDKKEEIARAVGIGAVKYADFSNNRTSDYVFSFDKMLAMEGNTAPYMQYAYARVKSIGRKAQERGIDFENELARIKKIALDEPAELDLAKHLIRYGEAIESAIADYRPNYLTSYLYELAQKFSVFYTNCPVLDAGPNKRPTRLLLCDLTANTIRHGLSELLGINVIDQM